MNSFGFFPFFLLSKACFRGWIDAMVKWLTFQVFARFVGKLVEWMTRDADWITLIKKKFLLPTVGDELGEKSHTSSTFFFRVYLTV